MTHAISSYTPTLSSLLQALERSSEAKQEIIRMLLISQPASPPSRPLPCVNTERDGILATLREIKPDDQAQVTLLHDSAGRVADTKSLLSTHEMLHLACHGKQNKDDPLESAIILYDGQMTLREIVKTPLPSAELVYLSACQTATGEPSELMS
jgi:CHAT domain-containing protein